MLTNSNSYIFEVTNDNQLRYGAYATLWLDQSRKNEVCKSDMSANSNNSDLRVVKTQKAIWEAMVALTIEIGYEKLSVNDICKKAEINRSTFYRHYEDKNDLLLRRTDEILFSIAANAKKVQIVAENQDYSEYKEFLKFIDTNRSFSKSC